MLKVQNCIMPSAVTELLQFPVPDKKEIIDMKKFLLYLGFLILCTSSASPVIVYSPAATAAEKTAVQELAEHLKKMGLKARSILLDPKKKYKGSVRPNYTVSELNTLPIIVRNETNGVAEKARQLARSKNR
jgi:hypothetical protein